MPDSRSFHRDPLTLCRRNMMKNFLSRLIVALAQEPDCRGIVPANNVFIC